MTTAMTDTTVTLSEPMNTTVVAETETSNNSDSTNISNNEHPVAIGLDITTSPENAGNDNETTCSDEDIEEELCEIFGNPIFDEPEHFRPKTPPPQNLFVVLTKDLYYDISLVGEHSLWAHCLWNSSKCISKWFSLKNTPVRQWKEAREISDEEVQPTYPIIYEKAPNIIMDQCPVIRDKCVMELGAGGSLPSMTCALYGARRVLCTDFPEDNLLDMTRQTWIDNFGREQFERVMEQEEASVEIRGHLWGNMEQLRMRPDCVYDELGRFVRKKKTTTTSDDGDDGNGDQVVVATEENKENQTTTTASTTIETTTTTTTSMTTTTTTEEPSQDSQRAPPQTEKFDIIILSDLIFNTSTHEEMMTTVKHCSIPNHTEIYLTYSHHRPHKKRQELKAFEEAKYLGIEFELLFVEKYPPMFPEDPYPVAEREKVWVWRGKLKSSGDGDAAPSS